MPMRILCLRLRLRSDEESPGRERTRAPQHAVPDAALRARLADDVEEFSPLFGWVGAGEAASLCLDVGPTAHGFGGETALLERLRAWAERRRLLGTIALADTLGAAWGVAHFGFHDEPIAWRCRVVPPGRQAAALAALPVAALRLSFSTTALLQELGLARIGPLLPLPREALAERFPPELLLRIDQALGNMPELFAAHRPSPLWEAKLAWEGGVTNAEPLVAAWRSLLPQLLAPLRQRGRGITRLLAEQTGESYTLRRFVVGLLRPTLDADHLLGLLQLRLETERLREPIVGTRLAVLEETPLAVQQQVLFADLAPPVESQAWAVLVERLSGRLGHEAVVRVRARADHQPERAWQAVPWLQPRETSGPTAGPVKASPLRKRSASRKAAPEADSEPSHKLPRPTLLLPRPQPIRVFAVAPQGHPHRFESGGRERQVVESWGPERLETGWWRGPSLRRDYFRVLIADGRRCWLFRELRTGRWFLHGWFD